MTFELALGITGMLLILAAFVIEELYRHTRHESITYNILNLAGAALLVLYAWMIRSWPFLILNAVWSVVAAGKLTVLVGRKR